MAGGCVWLFPVPTVASYVTPSRSEDHPRPFQQRMDRLEGHPKAVGNVSHRQPAFIQHAHRVPPLLVWHVADVPNVRAFARWHVSRP